MTIRNPRNNKELLFTGDESALELSEKLSDLGVLDNRDPVELHLSVSELKSIEIYT